jgi:L-ribulose-5-phosphate 3-epimerase
MNRRDFLQTGAGALALASLAPGALAAEANTAGTAAAPKRSLKKGIMWGTVGVKGSVLEKMKAIKEAGFEGTEMMSHMDQEEVLRARDATGLATRRKSCARATQRAWPFPAFAAGTTGASRCQTLTRRCARRGSNP